MMREESTTPRGSVLVHYNLAEPEQWAVAGEERRAWGRAQTEVHVLTNDVIAVEFKPGGALEASS